MEYEIPIPHCFLRITEKYTMRASLFNNYVFGYMQKSFPEFKPLEIDTTRMVVICEKSQGVSKK